jgi:predicted enzyme related to lactoylglutathione lyase
MSVRLTPIIIFVRDFDRCLEFYQKAFELEVARLYRRPEDPWAELQVGEIRLALHGGYQGPPYRTGRPVAIHFEVKDIHQTVGRIKQYGGGVKRPPKMFDARPAELQVGYQAHFTDPDGNEFEVLQVLEQFTE